jgi:hypothetical protein
LGLSCLARNGRSRPSAPLRGRGKPRGRQVSTPPLRHRRSRPLPSFGHLQAIGGKLVRSWPSAREDGYRSIGARGHACQSNEKMSRRSNGRPRIPEPDHTEPARNSSPTPQRAFAVVEWRQWPDIIVLSTISDPLANRLETEPDEPSTWSLTAADQTQNQQQRPARRRTGRRMPNAPMPPPPRSLRPRRP